MDGLTFNEKDGTLTAVISGELDHCLAAAVRDRIDERLQERIPAGLVLDISRITFMDSSGIGLIMGRSKLMKECGGRLEVLNPQPYIRRVMKLAGIERIVKIR